MLGQYKQKSDFGWGWTLKLIEIQVTALQRDDIMSSYSFS